MDSSQLPLKQIELKNNKLFIIILVCTSIFSILNFSINYYMIKSLKHYNTNGNQNDILLRKSSMLFKKDAKFENDLKTKIIDGIKFDQLEIDNENSFKLKSEDGLSYFMMGENKIEIQTNDFRILNQDERTGQKIETFRLKDNELFLRNVENLNINKPGGLDISNSLETQSLIGGFNNDLELNSLTKNIEINSRNELNLNSKYSQMNLESLKDLNLNGEKIVLDSKYINFKKLNKNQVANKLDDKNEMYSQVCVCKNGRLFTTMGNQSCKDENRNICY